MKGTKGTSYTGQSDPVENERRAVGRDETLELVTIIPVNTY